MPPPSRSPEIDIEYVLREGWVPLRTDARYASQDGEPTRGPHEAARRYRMLKAITCRLGHFVCFG